MGLDLFGDTEAAKAQQAAQDKAERDALNAYADAQQRQSYYTQQGIQEVGGTSMAQADALAQAWQNGQGFLGAGQAASSGALGAAHNASLGDLLAGYGQGRSDLSSAYGQAGGQLGSLATLGGYGAGAARSIGAYDVAGRAPNRLGAMLDQPGGLYGGFQQDPGYQFRLQQGQNAIMSQASAAGGRGSARTMQALADYNQGQASQEYGSFAARQQAAAGIAGSADQYGLGALMNQAGRSDAAALAAQNNQMGLAGIGYGAQSNLAQLMAQYGQQQAGMSSQLGGMQSGLESQYGSNMSDLSNLYAMRLAGGEQQAAQASANMRMQGAEDVSNIGLGYAASGMQGSQQLGALYQNNAQYGGLAQQAEANGNREGAMSFAALMAAIYSDARLKTDIETVPGSRYEPLGLRGVKWTWNHRAENLGLRGGGEGVIAQEVMLRYPSAVALSGDWLVVDYGALEMMLLAEHA